MNIRITIISILLGLIGCTSNVRSTDDEVVAKVAGKSLTIGEAKQMIPPFIMHQDSINAIQSYANQWVQKQVALEHARRIGIHNTDQFYRKMQSYEEQILNTLLREHILESNLDKIEVTHDEALTYYQSYREQLTFNEPFVRFRIISTQTRTDAESANIDLINGNEWEEILNRYSINPEYQLRQSTQFWPISLAASDLPVINQNLRTLGLTERSSIHYDGNYYHLVQLMEERTVDEYPDLDWLIPQISEWLKLEKSRRITNAYLRNLYLQADSNNEIELRNVSEIEQILTN
jgi:hypothetical protein